MYDIKIFLVKTAIILLFYSVFDKFGGVNMVVKKKKSTVKSKKLMYEVYGILLISFAIYLFICIYCGSDNIIPQTLSSVSGGLCGFGAFIIPFLILLLGLGLIVRQDKMTIKLKFYALCFLFIFFLVLIEVGPSIDMVTDGFIEKVKSAYTNGIAGAGGGALGEIIAYPLAGLFGKAGAYLFSGTFIIINILILTNASVYRAAAAIKRWFVKLYGKMKDLKSAREDENFESADAEAANDRDPKIPGKEKSKYIDEVNKKIKILDFFKASGLEETEEKTDTEALNTAEEKVDNDVHIPAKDKKDSKNQDKLNVKIKQVPQKYTIPPVSLLNNPVASKGINDKKELINNAKILEETLESFGVEARVVQVSRGPVITRYELQPSPGVKVSKIVNLSDDIALNLAAPAVRIEAPVPGKAVVGIEVPNKEMSAVFLREVIESKDFLEKESSLTFALGKDVTGNCIVSDLSKMPHLLIAGATGSGKSVCINALITSILYKASPEKVRLLMIDPKVVELSTYNGIPHLLIPVVTDPRKAAGALGWAVQEMVNRYKLFADNNVRNIESYNDLMNQKSPESLLPNIVVIIDELADLMMVAPNDVEDCICRLAQMARAAGMHLVVATQRPSVDVLTGVIKANIPSRISFGVSSQIDSRTILDMAGAEKLLGKGDMLYYPVGESKPLRVQGAFISEKEVEQVVEYVKNQSISDYKDDIIDEIEGSNEYSDEADELLPQAIQVVVETGQASISLLQRRLKIGYNRAARLIDSMQERGIVGRYEGSKPRQVLITKDQYEEMF